MLIVHRIGPQAGAYYLDGRHPGEWTPGAAHLLDLSGPVTGRDLAAVLAGRDPRDGAGLARRRPRRRRAGWDLIFAAPKSVSLVAAGAEPTVAARVGAAHRAAVGAVAAHLEAGLTVRSVTASAPGAEAEGLVAAAFHHTQSAAGEPHLHTHLLVANISRSGSVWSAVDPVEWQLDRRALTARYHLELRHHLEAVGLGVGWRLGEGGLGDLAAVPAAAVRAASTQSRLAARLGRLGARTQAVPSKWQERVVAAGMPPAAATSGRDGPAGSEPAVTDPCPDAGLERRVAARLGAARSDFRSADVVVALAACHPGGMPSAEVTAWVQRWCAAALPVPSPTSRPRWTTPGAKRLDSELQEELLLRQGGTVVLSGRPGECRLLAHAEQIERWSEQWAAAGTGVWLDTVDAESAERWRILTGIGSDRPAGRDGVCVVDRADRRPSAYLLDLSRSSDGLLVLVEGGTRPRLTNPVSHGGRDAASVLGRVVAPDPEPWRIARPGPRPPGRGRAAAEELLDTWAGAGRRGVLVGAGMDEVAALNRAASAPGQDEGERWVGDRVMVTRGGGGLPRYGTLGTVTSTDPLAVSWSGAAPVALPAGADRRVAPGWAVSPRVAARSGLTPLVLGASPRTDLGRLLGGDRRPALGVEPPRLAL